MYRKFLAVLIAALFVITAFPVSAMASPTGTAVAGSLPAPGGLAVVNRAEDAGLRIALME